MDVPTLKLVLRPILTVTSECNTGETSDIHTWMKNVILEPFKRVVLVTSCTVTSLKGSMGLYNLVWGKSCQELYCINVLSVDPQEHSLHIKKLK